MNTAATDIASRSVERVRETVLAWLGAEDVAVWLVGSRARGTAGRRSDIDVAYRARAPLDPRIRHGLREALDDLPIPYTVDLVDLAEASAAFGAAALEEAIPWKR